MKKLLIIVNVDWSFMSNRLPVALAAQSDGFEVHIAVGLTQPASHLEKYGFVVHPLRLSRGSQSLVQAWCLFWAIWQLLGTVRPDVVHLVSIKPVIIGGIATRFRKVARVIAAVPGLGYVFTAKGMLASLRRGLVSFMYRMALSHRRAVLIFQNDDDRRLLCQSAHLESVPYVMIRGSGVDLEQWAARPMPQGKPIVMMASRLLRDKGVIEFVEAARMLRGQNAVTFVLVGGVDNENPTSLSQSQVDALVQEGCVQVWGHRDDMRDVLSQATIVVLPSYREGLPKVLIEAAALGRPCITTDVPGCRDAIANHRTGLLVKPQSASELANAVETLLNDRERLAQMASESRKFAEERFSLHSVIEMHLQLYRG